jgi:hypothetical protein
MAARASNRARAIVHWIRRTPDAGDKHIGRFVGVVGIYLDCGPRRFPNAEPKYCRAAQAQELLAFEIPELLNAASVEAEKQETVCGWRPSFIDRHIVEWVDASRETPSRNSGKTCRVVSSTPISRSERCTRSALALRPERSKEHRKQPCATQLEKNEVSITTEVRLYPQSRLCCPPDRL